MALSMASSATLVGGSAQPSSPLHVVPVESTLDQRWEAWRARGAAHEALVRRRAKLALPIVFVVAAALYALFVR